MVKSKITPEQWENIPNNLKMYFLAPGEEVEGLKDVLNRITNETVEASPEQIVEKMQFRNRAFAFAANDLVDDGIIDGVLDPYTKGETLRDQYPPKNHVPSYLTRKGLSKLSQKEYDNIPDCIKPFFYEPGEEIEPCDLKVDITEAAADIGMMNLIHIFDNLVYRTVLGKGYDRSNILSRTEADLIIAMGNCEVLQEPREDETRYYLRRCAVGEH